MGGENKQHKHTVIYNIALFCIVPTAPWILFNKSPVKNLHNTRYTLGKTETALRFIYFLTQTQQSLRNNLKGSEQSAEIAFQET